MFIVNKVNNEAIEVEKKTFTELGFREREHLQEWIAKNPAMLREELLIIQKEFSGFEGTGERLDLLALDKNGDLVIIENKLDDSGRDVTWQALKYVSYCSALTTSEVVEIFQNYLGAGKEAESEICDFLEQDDFSEVTLNQGDQRIIFTAANFRKEVTSTVMWLMDHKIKIKCIKVTPYIYGDDIFIDTEQIIPVKDAEDYLIKLAAKKQEEMIVSETKKTRYAVRIDFWEYLLSKMNEKSDLFSNINPSNDNWLQSGNIGYGGIGYNFVTNNKKKLVRVELYMGTTSGEVNKQVFDGLYLKKEQIEADFGHKLSWERMDDKKASKIAYYLNDDISIFNDDDWEKIIDFLVKNMIKLEAAMRDELKTIISNIKSK